MQKEDTKIFQIIKWNAVASWVSDSQGQTCSICKDDLERICPHCVQRADSSIACEVVKGECCHQFHKHCLDKWFQNNKSNRCLHCSSMWNQIRSITIEQ